MTYKQPSAIIVKEGGTGVKTTTAYAPLTGGITAQAALQNAGTGVTDEVLTSLGVGTLPLWLPPPTFFEPLAADPGAPAIGDTWYNTTEHEFKGYMGGIASIGWVIKSDLNTGRGQSAAAGDGGDGLTFGGYDPTPNDSTERYDGNTDVWTVKANMSQNSTALGGAGSAADALAFGGLIFSPGASGTKKTERYDGGADTWTTKTNLNVFRRWTAGAGTTGEDVLAFGGFSGVAPNYPAATERYDGTLDTWTVKGNLNFPRSQLSGGGSAGDCLSAGGKDATVAPISFVEEYDGGTDTWTSRANLNQGRGFLAGAASTASSFLSYGGKTAGPGGVIEDTTEEYDGGTNTWSFVSDMNFAETKMSGCGSPLDALAIGGSLNIATTERYNGTGAAVVTFDTTP